MGFTGGVEATPLGNDAFVVHSMVNGYTSQGTAVEYAYRRASELCPRGFHLADSATSSTSSYWRTQYGVQQVNKPEVTIVVQCNRPDPAPPSPPPRVAGEQWWCTEAAGYTTGHCDRQRENCENMRAQMLAKGGYVLAVCSPRSVAYCHNQRVDALVVELCDPSIEGCRFSRANATAPILSDCIAR
jgi:hypothetical protein